jgi:hypothetical protein
MLAAAMAMLLVIATAAPAGAGVDPILEWNDVARQLVVVPALSPVEQTRLMAIVHVAMHDAVSGITGEYERYARGAAPPAGAAPEAAAISAAFTALKQLFPAPDAQALLAGRFSTSLQDNAVAPSDPGIAFGAAVAAGILALRQNDGASVARYVFIPAGAGSIGVWAPVSTAPAAQSLLPGWGAVTTWVLRSGAQFRPDAPPDVGSRRFARDQDEVRTVGAQSSLARTGEQTQIALFWRASPTAIWNPVLRQAVEARALSLSDTARVTALFYMAASDASVACWEAKYYYNFWRPQAAIVAGDEDGNTRTAGDPAWLPLVPTPPHPEYPSGHTANSGAMAAILTLLFGDSPGFVIVATSSQNPGFVRKWDTFSEGVDEVVDARVSSGIHFRTADTVGARLGRQVARFVLTHALKPAKRR